MSENLEHPPLLIQILTNEEAGDTYYFCEELDQTSWVKPASMNDGGRADRPEGLQVATSFDINDPTAIPQRKRIMTVVSQI